MECMCTRVFVRVCVRVWFCACVWVRAGELGNYLVVGESVFPYSMHMHSLSLLSTSNLTMMARCCRKHAALGVLLLKKCTASDIYWFAFSKNERKNGMNNDYFNYFLHWLYFVTLFSTWMLTLHRVINNITKARASQPGNRIYKNKLFNPFDPVYRRLCHIFEGVGWYVLKTAFEIAFESRISSSEGMQSFMRCCKFSSEHRNSLIINELYKVRLYITHLTMSNI